MKTKLPLAVLACGMMALAGCKKESSSGGGDNNEYTIDLRQPGAGSTMQGTMKIEMKFAMNVTDEKGRPQEKKDVNLKDEVTYRETILEWPTGRKKPTKSKILFEKWERGKDGGIGDEGVRQRIVGREVLFQKHGPEYEFRTLDNQPLDHNVRVYLEERYNELFENFNARDFLPDKPVKTMTPWDIDVRKLLAAAMKAQGGNVPLDTRKAKGTGKLLSVTENDGRKYGTIELRVDFGELEMPKEPGLVMKTTGKMELLFTIEACIDGSKHDVKATAKMEFGIDAKHPQHGAMKMDVKLNLDIQERETTIGTRSDDPKAPRTTKGRQDSGGGAVNFPDEKFERPQFEEEFAKPDPPKSSISPRPSPGGKGPYDGKSVVPPRFDDPPPQYKLPPEPVPPSFEKDPPKFDFPKEAPPPGPKVAPPPPKA